MQCPKVRSSPPWQRGFTLIELLVVIGIIALLVSILLPAVGEVQRQARVSRCVSNMKQHGVGTETYAGANNDTLPNAPLVTAGNNPAFYNTIGQPGSVASWYSGVAGTPQGEIVLNGFRWNSPVNHIHSPAGINQVINGTYTYNNMQGWAVYWHYLSQYMVDGEGLDALEGVFHSPSDKIGPAEVQALKEKVRENEGGPIPNTGADAISAILPSYRYTVCAMTKPVIYEFTSTGAVKAPDANPQSDTAWSTAIKQKYLKQIPKAEVLYPSQKALYWLWWAWHNPEKETYFESGATIPVCLADGSARASVPSRDAIPYSTNLEQRYQGAGAYLQIGYVEQTGGTVWHDAYFLCTNGGIRGRDFE